MPRSIVVVVAAVLAVLLAGYWGWQRWGQDLLRRSTQGPAATQATKCLQGGQVLYTDGPCPAGSRAMAADGGTVSVVPAQKTMPALPALPVASVPNVRQVLAPDGGPDLREQRMEKIIGK